ncbi:signal-induced proliferation-associated 1-like protein 3 isoform X3 [Brienomyrus brachyistius]|uniref:signal-induced proliferation-associated 1-like protein 3 isoform X3 n=1 Tax=Brienomyrus brachyistius TaxID=42636 RepID=UPI0020B3F18A|nr:signal-induced proliferation-associated 1-like protein 3 isoform X3 [Brienomyrus brachyistius]
MQSDDLFVRKFCRQSPRPPLTAMSFEPRRDPSLRSQVKPEWPPRREEEEVMLGESPPPSQAGPGLRSSARGHIVQRSNSEVILGGLETSGAAYGVRAKAPGMGSLGSQDDPSPLLHRDYGSLSSLERRSCADTEDSEEKMAQSPAALRFKDPLILLGLQGTDIEPDGFSRALDVPDGEPLKQAKAPKQDAQNKKGKSSPTLPPRTCPADSLPGATWVHNFAHYDVQSVLFDLTEAVSSRNSIGRKKNITSGASAASHVQPSTSGAVLQLVGGVGGDGGTAEDPEGQREMLLPPDEGDGNNNDMLLSCPHFRNETGGEERPGLGRVRGAGVPWLGLQSPNDAVSILEEPRESHVQQQPKTSYFIEHADLGAHYYRKYFHMKDHQNFFGVDERLGAVAISFRREEKEGSSGAQYNYRIIFRTTELKTLRGSVAEESVSTGARHTGPRGLPHRRLLEHILPELNLHCLRLGSNSPKVPELLLKLDEQRLNFQRKVGVMYCRANQSSEEDMYNNEYASLAFEEFLDLLGQKVQLQGFDKFRAQLDTKTDSTGTHSLYTKYQDYEIMFHVSTMLPYTPSNTQQLLRKRHIGNDIVTIVFQEPGALPFTPKTIRSHFQHVFIIVQVHHPCTDNTYYRVAVTRSKDIPLFGPFFPKGARFRRSPAFRDFLLAKALSAENAAEKSEKFLSMATRTRQGYLKDLAENYVTTSPIDSSTKFPLLSRVKRKDKPKSTKGAELHSAGALVWPVMASGGGPSAEKLPCLLAISGESVVLIEWSSRLVVFNCNSRDVIGWKAVTEGGASGGPYLDIYYERGESISISVAESQVEDIREVVQRLKRVSGACEVREVMPLRDSVGHPGFMLSEDGFVVELQQSSYTESAGLQMGARVVRLCGRPLVALSAADRASLLRSTPRIHLTVIPPDKNGKQARSLSELYQKALQGTELKPGDNQSREAWVVEEKEDQEEPKGQEAQEHRHSGVRDQCSLVSPPCPPLQRATAFQDDSAGRPSPTGSYLLETPQLQPNPSSDRHFYDNRVQRRKMHIYEVPVEVQTTTPDLIPKALVEEKEDLRQQALSSPCRTPEVVAPPTSEPLAPLESTDHSSSAQNVQNSLNKILLEPGDSTDEEWQSISAVASACHSILEAMCHEEMRAAGDVAQAPGDGLVTDGQVDSIMKDSMESSNFPRDLGEKVSQLENILKRLEADLQKEKEDKAELQAEVLTLRENNQRLREESQSTVARLIKVTELLCRTTKH